MLDRASWDGTRQNVGGTTLCQGLASVRCLGNDLRIDVLMSSAERRGNSLLLSRLYITFFSAVEVLLGTVLCYLEG